jgi:tRNA U55 pseudouridine synthase TruB
LRRSAIGPFRIEDALPLDEIARRREQSLEPGPAWLPLDRIPLPFSEVLVDGGQERRLRDGQTVLVQGASAGLGDWIRLADRRGALIAIGSVTERVGAGTVAVVQPRIVFLPPTAVIMSPRP